MPSRFLLCAAVIAASPAVFGCSEAKTTQPPLQGPCAVCKAPSGQGTAKNPAIAEASGLAASALHDDVVYVHNDKGDSARFFAMSRAGADLATYNVAGAKNDDWEDIGRGPCIPGSCLYIGDIGDNSLDRDEYAVYRVAEPTSIKAGEQGIAAEKLAFVYPSGSHDAEVLLVHPLTGAITIVTKVDVGAARIFELPLPNSPSKTVTAVAAGEVSPTAGSSKFTGGSVHPEAKGILLRTTSDLFYYPMKPEQTVAQALAGGACELLVADEEQGEAVTWLPSGAAFMTMGEGEGTSITVAECDPL